MAKNTPRVLILDPDFEHDAGHNYVANHVLSDNIKLPISVLCPVNLPANVSIPGVEMSRRFPCSSYLENTVPKRGRVGRFLAKTLKLPDRKPDYAKFLDKFTNVILDHFHLLKITFSDAVLVHTGSAFLFDALLGALEKWPRKDWPDLHLRQLRPIEETDRTNAIHSRLNSAREHTNVYMYAETDGFARSLMQLGYDERAVDKLEISDLRQTIAAANTPQANLLVAVLGTIRREKGHQRLVGIAKAYRAAANPHKDPALKFLIQTGAIKNRELFERFIAELEEAGINFDIVKEPQGIAGHWQCLADCHVVLVPYEPDRYTNRGSGICIDAIAAGRPLVVSANCTLEEYIRDNNGLSATSDDEFAAGILKIARDHNTYIENAARQAKKIQSAQQSHKLFSRLKK